MTEEPFDQQPTESVAGMPRTGEPVVDQALEALQGLDATPLDERPDRLARVHEDLHRALNSE